MDEDEIQALPTLIVGHIIAACIAVPLFGASEGGGVVIAIIIVQSQVVLLGQWFGLSTWKWWKQSAMWCCLLAGVMLAVAAPNRQFDSLVLLGGEVLAVAAVAKIMKIFGKRATQDIQPIELSQSFRWSIGDLLLLTVFVAFLSAVARIPSWDDWRQAGYTLREVLPLLIWAILFSPITLWACLSKGSPRWRVPIVFVFAIALTALTLDNEYIGWIEIVVFSLGCSGVVICSLLLVRASGIRLTGAKSAKPEAAVP